MSLTTVPNPFIRLEPLSLCSPIETNRDLWAKRPMLLASLTYALALTINSTALSKSAEVLD
jgi:hypothetical protein